MILGTTAPLFSVTLNRVLHFTVYQNAKYAIDTAMQSAGMDSPLRIVNQPGLYPGLHTVACFTVAGAISGAVLSVVVCECYF